MFSLFREHLAASTGTTSQESLNRQFTETFLLCQPWLLAIPFTLRYRLSNRNGRSFVRLPTLTTYWLSRFTSVSSTKKNVSRVATIVVFYVASAVWFYDMQERSLPPLIAMFVDGFTLPLRYMFRPLYPIMKPFGWVVSDGADLPTPYGIIAGTVAWIGILAIVAYIFSTKPDKKRAHEEYWGG